MIKIFCFALAKSYLCKKLQDAEKSKNSQHHRNIPCQEYLSYKELHESYYDIYPENTPGVINVWTHGINEKNDEKKK